MDLSSGRFVARGGWLVALLVAAVASGCTSTAVTCPEGQTSCGGTCFDLATDELHCGDCNITCSVGATCTDRVCVCPVGQTRCGNACVDLSTSAAHCGTCGHACGLGTCAAAACACNATPSTVALCPPASATGTCVDTASSASNCGACGAVCIAGEVCSSSACTCVAPKQVCGTGAATVCTDVSSDPRNCGSCGTACAAGQTCASGSCQATCVAGLTLCGTSCVDLKTDPAHCGSCTTTCPAGQGCSGGACQAACTTLQCGGTCCQAPSAGNSCCGAACPLQHKNFVGTSSEQTYYNCAAPLVWDLGTAQTAARAWAPGGNQITPTQSCPASGGSLCLVWQKPIGALDIGCAVFCYSGPFEGAATVTTDYTCPCPLQQQTDWY